MSVSFSPSRLSQDLGIMANVASEFLAPGGKQHLETLAKKLNTAVHSTRTGGAPDFRLVSQEGNIQTRPSRNWKGETNDFDPVKADISIDYCFQYQPGPDRVLVKEGVTVVTIADVPSSDGDVPRKKVFHFDVCKGNTGRAAGHPPFHGQFYGFLNDVPRLPTFIFHPMDVLNFTPLELFQSHWHKHIATTATKSKLRDFPLEQHRRFLAVFRHWSDLLSTPRGHALIALQREMAVPLAL